MADYNLKVITADTDGPSADTELLFGSPDQSSGTPKPYSFAGIKTWVNGFNGRAVHPGYKAGNWYIGTGISTGVTVSSNGTVLNTLYLFPFFMPQKVTLSELGINVVTGIASSNTQLGIYRTTSEGRTGTFVAATGSIATVTSGNKTGVFAGSATPQLDAGWYFFVMNTDISGVVVSTVGPTGIPINQIYGGTTIGAISAGGTNSNGVALSVAQTYNTWPDLTGATIVETIGQQRGPFPMFKVVSVP